MRTAHPAMAQLRKLFKILIATLFSLCGTLASHAQAPYTLIHAIPSPCCGAQTGGHLGNSVALDGNYLVAGVFDDDTGAENSGVVKVFHSETGELLYVLSNPTPARSDNFGISVAISGTTVVVGAVYDDTGAPHTGSAYVYDLSSPTPTVPTITLHNPSPEEDDGFGYAVAISGSKVIIGAFSDNTGITGAGSAYVYDLSAPIPTVPVVTLNNPSPGGGDDFGVSVAISGTRVVVGAHWDDTGAHDAGSAYVYDLAGAAPSIPTFTLNNPSPTANDNFGNSVAISAARVIIGAHMDDTGAPDTGIAYVYDLTTSTPTVPAFTLTNPSPAPIDFFGKSVAISGTRVVVGALWDDTGASDSGSAYVYDLTSATPTVPTLTLNNPTQAFTDFFGSSVAILGTRVVVGAQQDDLGATDAGSAYVYELTTETPTVPTLTLNNPGLSSNELFGSSVAISGNLLVVGAYLDDSGADDAGIVHVYDLTGSTPTVPIATLNNPSPALGDNFGKSVAISGTWVIVGADMDDTGATDAGSAYLYDLTSATPNSPIFTLNNPSPGTFDHFGASVAISGTRIVVGAPQDDTGGSDVGSAYVYDLVGPKPTEPTVTLNNPGPSFGDNFGWSVAISGTTVIIGAPRNDTGMTNAGRAFVYDLTRANPALPAATLNNPSPAVDDAYGWSVAVSGTRIVIGAYTDDTGAYNAGIAYVYDLSNATPSVPIATLSRPSPSDSDVFGYSVAISDDRVVVGAFLDQAGATNTGRAFVYDLHSSTPSLPVATLSHPAPEENDYFGFCVTISETTIAIGAPYRNHVMADKGFAYVFAPALPDIAVAQTGPLTDGGTVSFGSVNLGNSSAPLTFTITNPGTDTLQNLVLTGSTNEFALSALTATSIPVGTGSVSFSVTFTPSTGGIRAATLQLASNVSGSKNPLEINLTGIGVNLPPTFSNYTLQATQGSPATLSLATLLARAADADGGQLSLSNVSAVSTQGGSVSNGVNTITYSPPANFTGLDTFSVTIGDGQGGSVEGNVMVVVTANGGPMGKLPMIMLQPSGKVAILFDAIPSQSYRIERSPDLLNWSPLQTTTAPTDGMLPYFDINPLPGQGFYRRIPQ